MNKISILLGIYLYCLCSVSVASDSAFTIQSEGTKINVDLVADGLSVPWGMVFLSANKILVTERQGAVIIIDLQTNKKTKVKNSPHVMAEGQGGMLDVALSPDFKTSGWLYFTYVKNIKGEGATVLARARLNKDQLNDWQDLLVTKSTTDTSRHFGSRIAIDEKGHVFFGVGDRGHRPNGQDLSNHAGTIMRLNFDGTIPHDNPFLKEQSALPEVWSYGHRNPQGMAYDFTNKQLWSIEHGPRGGDEINLIQRAANYGWPVISYGKEYWGPLNVGEGTHHDGMEQPVKVYVPSIAPGSLMIYSGNAFPKWKGNLLTGALKLQHINRIVIGKQGKAIKEERLLEKLGERIRALSQSPEGWIYFSTDSGKIYRLRPDS